MLSTNSVSQAGSEHPADLGACSQSPAAAADHRRGCGKRSAEPRSPWDDGRCGSLSTFVLGIPHGTWGFS